MTQAGCPTEALRLMEEELGMSKNWVGVLLVAALVAIAMLASPAGRDARADAPTEVNIAAIFSVGIEQPWDKAWYDDFLRLQEEQPHGLTLNLDYTEHVWGDKAEAIMRAYAQTGKYDIIVATSTFSDQVRNLKDRFPEVLWVVQGSGNEGLGGRVFWNYMRVHEPAYLMGIIAGMMTETDTIGVVGTFPADDANDEINGFVMGAKSVNPDVGAKITFIESWYDPPKANEAVSAQVAAGADMVLQLGGAFESCVEKQILCFGNFIDMNSLAPDHIVTSAVAHWGPTIRNTIDAWYRHKTTGEAIDAPKEPIWFGMKDGGSDLAPFHSFEDRLPDEVKDKVEEVRAAIMSGEFEVPLDVSVPVSD